MPERIQRSRAKGWRMPPNTVYVGRGSRWGNPFPIDHARQYHAEMGQPDNGESPRNTAVRWYREWLAGDDLDGELPPPPVAEEIRRELRGKNLACWCPIGQPCHADILLELANRD